MRRVAADAAGLERPTKKRAREGHGDGPTFSAAPENEASEHDQTTLKY
jgi:hypothetical protein